MSIISTRQQLPALRRPSSPSSSFSSSFSFSSSSSSSSSSQIRASSAGGNGRSRRMVLPPFTAVRQAKKRGMTSRNVSGREGRGEGEREGGEGGEGGEGSEINRNGDVSVSVDENDPIVQTATMLMNLKMQRALAARNLDKLKMLLRDLKYNERVEEKERTKGSWESTIDGVKKERQV
ncbi:uncharacterized protein MONOS_14520 [Monocercomonoides exilis]|uniref:uncharacterized protein n=1 Tax=Monocercomonoides exilis TaxID=2049356 RepID=UPI00355A9FDE|nr:hypothetical protein MONOS_14520 [Monocercomonoides exilis]|eukprot:MONOS_14520.1-p1 / transcript=MONOS_14520.1 / gene=MONOS_14520 / organism=Monocercomonoides_exilis_PA203 / gene_product=unspecified product / transcript_product=unspecified product / location=Mono_scaffold01017:5677-6506(-) / protein_length=178 / sequence_SO=supercontig / SO=protein_coding / is_pseudo=false